MDVAVTSGAFVSGAGSPLAQTRAAETERAAKDAVANERHVDGQEKSEKASGIGQTEEDSQTSDRDADGRRLWEESGNRKKPADSSTTEPPRHVKDPTGVSGNELDLTG